VFDVFGRGYRARVERAGMLEDLLGLGGEPIALFDPKGRVLVAAPPLLNALGGRPASEVEGREVETIGLPGDVGARLARVVARSTSGRETIVEPTIAPGREVTVTPLRSGDGIRVGLTAYGGTRAETARFLSAANHDLRQPFQAMRLFHHLLASRLVDPGQIDIADKLDHSIEAADRGLTDLVLTARLDAGLIIPDHREFPLAMMLIPLLDEYRERFLAAGISFRVRLGPAEGDQTVWSDQHLLETLTRRLLDNAARFADPKGVLFGVRRRGSSVALEVWDRGPGVPDAEREAVFHDFQRGQARPRDGMAGLGLGLGIARRVARALDLPLELASRPGKGSVFRVRVPTERGGAA